MQVAAKALTTKRCRDEPGRGGTPASEFQDRCLQNARGPEPSLSTGWIGLFAGCRRRCSSTGHVGRRRPARTLSGRTCRDQGSSRSARSEHFQVERPNERHKYEGLLIAAFRRTTKYERDGWYESQYESGDVKQALIRRAPEHDKKGESWFRITPYRSGSSRQGRARQLRARRLDLPGRAATALRSRRGPQDDDEGSGDRGFRLKSQPSWHMARLLCGRASEAGIFQLYHRVTMAALR